MKSQPEANPQSSTIEDTNILIVGFGFTCIPLLRLLEEHGQSYVIINKGETIWQRLKKHNKLNFSLVSSFHASYYTEDQVKDGRTQDFFPTSNEFYEYHEGLYEKFRDHVVEDYVFKVENSAKTGMSTVFTESGAVYKAKNVVFASGLGRPQNQKILDTSYEDIQNQTVVINMAGDTANMILSMLVPNDNKCILVSNGFLGFEKEMCINAPGPATDWWIPVLGFRLGHKYRSDLAQMECHTVHEWMPGMWGRFIGVVYNPSPDCWLAKNFTMPHQFFLKHPETYRSKTFNRLEQGRQSGGAGWSNSVVGIKYHAIDMFKTRYDDGCDDGYSLEDNIKRGVKLNDIAFFHQQGLVETWRKNFTTIDHENKTISMVQEDGTTRMTGFDLYFDGGFETPNLPPIFIVDHDSDDDNASCGLTHQFQYNYKETLYGVAPCRLKNVFLMGMTRPTTGGIANINEMQAMMVHKLLSDKTFKVQMYETIHARILKYNRYFYPVDEPNETSPTDHLVFYGLYTQEVAKFLGINRPIILTSVSSWNPFKIIRNLRFELLYPNNAIKFRMDGEYAIPGAKELATKAFGEYDDMSIPHFYFICVMLDQLLYYQCIGMLANTVAQTFYDASKSNGAWIAVAAVLPMVGIMVQWLRVNDHWIDHQTYNLAAVPGFGLKSHTQPVAMVYTLLYGQWYWCIGIYAFWSLVAFLSRQVFMNGLQGRYPFGDLKWKHKYLPFWEKYKRVYRKVEAERRVAKKVQ